LTVPGTGDPADPSDDFAVVDVNGSYDIQAKLAELGINDDFNQISMDFEDYSDVADTRNDGLNGLFPFLTGADDGSPWDFYAPDIPTIGIHGPPDPVRARTFIDTVFTYMAPRACIVLNLAPCLDASRCERNRGT
jgi:hypothetical protein